MQKYIQNTIIGDAILHTTFVIRDVVKFNVPSTMQISQFFSSIPSFVFNNTTKYQSFESN